MFSIKEFPEFAVSDAKNKYISYKINDDCLGCKDLKAKRFFSATFNGGVTVELNFALFTFLTSINFVKYILENLVTESSSSYLKLKFVTLYHLGSSFEKLQNYYYSKNLLSTKSKKYFSAILKDKDFRSIREQSKLRNILVHYAIDGVRETELNPSLAMYGLVEYFLRGKTYKEFDVILTDQILRISRLLEEWLPWQMASNGFRKC